MRKIGVLLGLLGLALIGILFPDRIIDCVRSLMPQVRVRSEVVGVSLEQVDKKQIARILEEAQFFLPGKVTRYQANGKQMEGIEVRKLVIVLTDEIQPLGQVYGAGSKEMYQSYGAEYVTTEKPGVYDLKILLYVQPVIAESEEPQKLSARYAGLFLSAVWDLTHPKLVGHTGFERFEGRAEFVRQYVGQGLWMIARRGREK
jgi:hypothetical protein